MNTTLKTGLLAIATLACLHCGSADATYDDEGQSQGALSNPGPAGETYTPCSIDRNGLKIPGSNTGTQCCNLFDTKDCVDLPTPAPTSATKGTRPVILPPPNGATRAQ